MSSRAFGAPSGIAGVTVTVSCRQLLGGLSSSVSYDLTNGAAPLPTYWPLTAPTTNPANSGTNCVVSAAVRGTANLEKGEIAISIGGVDRTIEANTVRSPVLRTTTVNSGLVNGQFIGGLPVFSSTEIVVTLNYPHVAVQHSVYGFESNYGFEYPMTIACSANGSALTYFASFTLRSGYRRNFTTDDFPGMTSSSACEVQETNTNGALRLTYSSTVLNPDGTLTTAPGVGSGSTYRSALTKSGQTITVINDFIYYGEIAITKVVTGTTQSNGPFEVQLSCNNGGPKVTFQMNNGETKVFSNISEFSSCRVLETNSGGAVPSYLDNVGPSTTDGRIAIAHPGIECPQSGVAVCSATVVITNDFNPARGRYNPVTPTRIVDSRIGLGTHTHKIAAGETVAIQVQGNASVPPTARSAAMNVTVADAAAPGHVTVFACDQPRPTASNLNFVAGQTVANLVVSSLSAAGQVCAYASAPTELLADVFGYSDSGGQGFNPITPTRILDTRDGNGAAQRKTTDGEVLVLQATGRAGVPAGATGGVVNLTVTDPNGNGWIAVYRCDAPRPLVSNLNFVAGQTVANLVYAQFDGQGRTCIYSSVGAHLIADISGYFGPNGDGSGSALTTVQASRILDTRSGFSGRLAAGQTLALPVWGPGVASNATSVVINVTVTNPQAAGFVTVYPCDGPRPNASSVNFVAGATVPNLTETRISASGQVCIYTSALTDVIADVTGFR